MTTLLDRYLFAIRRYLPSDQPARDIAAEIGEDLRSQIDEREAAFGRALTEDEEAALLKDYGHPRVVAARYERVQYLIGPDLLPFYRSTLRWVAAIVVAIELLGGAVGALAAHNGLFFFDALYAAWHSLIWIFGIVTIVFAIGERVPDRMGRAGIVSMRWEPRRLPAPGARSPVPRRATLAEFIANFMALLVLLDANGSHRIPLDAIAANALLAMHVTLTAAWNAAYIGAIAGTALVALSAILAFARPGLTMLHEAGRAAASLVTIVGLAITLDAGPWIEPASSSLNLVALYCILAAMAILLLQLVFSGRALLFEPARPSSV